MESYQMENVGPLGIDAFLSSVERINSTISSLPAAITALESYHSTSVRDPDPSHANQLKTQISSSQAAITATIRTITNGISSLATDAGKTNNDYRGEKLNHVKNLKRKLRAQVDGFQQMENRVERMNRDALIRQYAIVRPEASPDEVATAVDQGLAGREDMFSQAIMQSGRSGAARSTLQNVRDRQAEIQHLAQTMQQLNELFQQMAQLVDSQDEIVKQTEHDADAVVTYIGKANDELDSGIKHAKLRRRWKWYCFWIVLAIIAILALVLGIYLGAFHHGKKNN